MNNATKGIFLLMARAIIAGMLIALGAILSMVPLVGAPLGGLGIPKIISGFAFATGLIMVYMMNASLYTGFTIDAVRSTRCQGLLNYFLELALIWSGNFLGSVLMVTFMANALPPELQQMLITIGTNKMALLSDCSDLIFKGIMCNVLVGLAVFSARKASRFIDLAVAIGVPIAVFVICGFEHSVANMFYLPAARACGAQIALVPALIQILTVSFGNFIGGLYMSLYEFELERRG